MAPKLACLQQFKFIRCLAELFIFLFPCRWEVMVLSPQGA